MKTKIIIILLFINNLTFAQKASIEVVPYIDLDIIAQIESSNNPKAVGDKGRSLGAFQVQEKVVKEFNTYHSKRYKHEDMFDIEKGRQVASWYFHKRIPQMLKAKGFEITKKNQIIAYNAGIRNVNKPLNKITANYLKKYEILSKKKVDLASN